ncbi:MAG: hypothetical protein LBT66_09345 [Methanobrevibacter sp.]|nr:hypothetical protein [Candidatus Methanovirga meridionalis]
MENNDILIKLIEEKFDKMYNKFDNLEKENKSPKESFEKDSNSLKESFEKDMYEKY